MTVEKLGELPSQGWAPVLWPQISGSKACGISVQPGAVLLSTKQQSCAVNGVPRTGIWSLRFHKSACRHTVAIAVISDRCDSDEYEVPSC